MNIYIVGTGVIGSAYATWLHTTGYHVTLLARGQ